MWNYVSAITMGNTCSFLVGTVNFINRSPINITDSKCILNEIKSAYNFGIPNSFASLIYFQNLGLDKLVISAYYGKSTMGLYSVISDIIQYTNNSIGSGIHGSMSNNFTRLFESGMLLANEYIVIIIRYVALPSFCLTLLSMLVLNTFFHYANYPIQETNFTLLNITILMFIFALSGPFYCLRTFGIDYWFFLSKRTSRILINSIFCFAAGSISLALFIWLFGPIGGALSVLLSCISILFLPQNIKIFVKYKVK